MSEEPTTTMPERKMPVGKLVTDLFESIQDLEIAQIAIKAGIVVYGDNRSVQERVDGNKKIIEIILAELKRRYVDEPETSGSDPEKVSG
jgi:hypothetical protein